MISHVEEGELPPIALLEKSALKVMFLLGNWTSRKTFSKKKQVRKLMGQTHNENFGVNPEVAILPYQIEISSQIKGNKTFRTSLCGVLLQRKNSG